MLSCRVRTVRFSSRLWLEGVCLWGVHPHHKALPYPIIPPATHTYTLQHPLLKCMLGYTSLWTEWQTGVKTLPSRNFVCGRYNKPWLNFILASHNVYGDDIVKSAVTTVRWMIVCFDHFTLWPRASRFMGSSTFSIPSRPRNRSAKSNSPIIITEVFTNDFQTSSNSN